MAAQPAERSFDVIVVGAGIMGSCAAHAAASRGARVLLLERFDLLHQRGSSHGESRTIRATYPQPHYPPMVRLSRRLWDDAQRDSGYAVLTPTPHLDLGPRDDPAFLASVANGGATVLAPAADAPRPAWAEAFKVPDGWAAASSELGGVMKATKAVAMFQALAAKMGAVVRDRAEVVDVARKQGEGTTKIVVKTSNGEEFHGAKCIITVGAWTNKLVKSVTGADLPVQPLHIVICYWKVKPGHERELTTEAGFPTFASYGFPYIYSTPSMEYPGLIKIAMHGGPPCDPDGRARRGEERSTRAGELARSRRRNPTSSKQQPATLQPAPEARSSSPHPPPAPDGPLEFPVPEPGPGPFSPPAPVSRRKRERRGFAWVTPSVRSEAVAVASLARIAGGYERRKQQLEDSPH